MSCGARTKTFPPHGASLMCPLGSGGGGGLVIGVDGVGTCCNLRDGTTKHSKKSSWSFKQFPWSWCDICAPNTPAIEKSCKTTNIVIAISSHEDTPKPPRILPITMTKVLIEFYKKIAANDEIRRARNLQ
jgi:hypothetical protein